MQRSFLSNLFLLLLLNLLVKPFYILGIDAEIQERVGTEIYGDYFALINLSFLLNILLDLGITNYNTRNIAREPELLQEQFSGLVILRIGLAVLYFLAAFIVGWILGYQGQEMWFLIILGFNQVLASYILFFRSYLTGLHLFGQDRVISVMDRILLILGMAWLLWGNSGGPDFKIEWLIYGQTLAYGITALVAFFLVARKNKRFSFKWKTSFAKNILKESIPYALLIFLTMIYNRTDGVMLERMLSNGDQEAGLYARGYRFFEASNMIAYLFAVILLPMFSRMLKNKTKTWPIVELSTKLLLAGSILLSVLCFYYSQELLGLKYSDQLQESADIFGLLMFGFVAVSLMYVFSTLLTAAGKMKVLNRIAIGGVSLNVLLNLWLIPEFGAWGSALASVFTQFLTVAFQILAVYQFLQYRKGLNLVIRSLIYLSSLILLLEFGTISEVSWQLNLGIAFLGGVILSLLTGLLNLKGFFRLLRSAA